MNSLRRPVAIVFGTALVGLVLVGTIAGLPGRATNHVIWSPARILFLPAGVILLGFAAAVRDPGRRTTVVWMALAGLAMIGVGAHRAWPGPWTALALPGTVAGAGRCALAAWRGSADPWTVRLNRPRTPSRRPRGSSMRRGRLIAAICAVLCAAGAVMALGAL